MAITGHEKKDTFYTYKLEFDNEPKIRWASGETLSTKLIDDYWKRRTNSNTNENCDTSKGISEK